MEKTKRKLYTAEKVLYLVFGVIWLTGFVFAILGVCAYNVGKLANNPLYTMQKNFATFFGQSGKVMDFRLWGTIVMVVAMLAFLIVIFAFSAKSTHEEAAKRRKEERMKILMESDLYSEPVMPEAEKEEAKNE